MSAAALAAALVTSVAANETNPAVHLSSDRPDVVTRVARERDEDPTRRGVIRIRVTRIENPGMTPFGIVVSLPGGAEIGRFSFFPADRTGDYYLSVTPEERAALLSDEPELHIALDLPTPPPEDIEVELTPAFLD
jgi:hypothetical protein